MAELKFWTLRKRRKKIRNAARHIKHVLHREDDILDESQKEELGNILYHVEKTDPGKEKQFKEFLEKTPVSVARVLPPKPFQTIRDYFDILAVAFMVAFGIRALFLQPFKIPTSSMQPTLFGIHYMDRNAIPDITPPLDYALFSAERARLKVREDGSFQPETISTFTKYLILEKTRFKIGDTAYVLPGNYQKVLDYCPLNDIEIYKKGQVLCDGWLSQGDHLFVDRFSHHFTGLKRGDVLVFNTEGIRNDGEKLAGYYYIKRLVGLPGDSITFRDGMVYIKPKGENNFLPVTEFSPRFKKIYSRKGGYHGHLPYGSLSPQEIIKVPPDSYFAMGDNSASSSDSRYWGFVPRKNVVGRGFFVFWPFSRRWGPVDVREPLPVDTLPSKGFPAMNMQ